MNVLAASFDGLAALADGLTKDANRIAPVVPPPSQTSSFQPTVDAVTAAHGRVAQTGQQLAERMRTTASKLSAAADTYAELETHSASQILTLGSVVSH